MAKLVLIKVRDLKKLMDFLREKNYDVEKGSHAVLLDHSEVEEFYLRKENKLAGIMISHYITPYYKVVKEHKDRDEEELLRALIDVKYSREKWFVPVNPVAVVTEDQELVNTLNRYRDDYPSQEARISMERYLAENPGSRDIFSGLLARVLEKLSQ